MKYLPSLVAVIVAVLSAFQGPVQAWIVAHPAVSAGIAAVWAILLHLSPPPTEMIPQK